MYFGSVNEHVTTWMGIGCCILCYFMCWSIHTGSYSSYHMSITVMGLQSHDCNRKASLNITMHPFYNVFIAIITNISSIHLISPDMLYNTLLHLFLDKLEQYCFRGMPLRQLFCCSNLPISTYTHTRKICFQCFDNIVAVIRY